MIKLNLKAACFALCAFSTFSVAFGAEDASNLAVTQKSLQEKDPALYKQAKDFATSANQHVQDAMHDSSFVDKTNQDLQKGVSRVRQAQEAVMQTEATALGLKSQSSPGYYVPNYPGNLFVFISLSMPDTLIKSYLREAHNAGAFVLIRGWDSDTTMYQFIKDKLVPLVSADGKSQGITMEPRYFDRYKVTAVPAIVYAKENFNLACSVPMPFKYKQKDLSYEGCPAANDDSYWKVTGAVSIWYALEAFKQAGAPVQTYVNFYRNQVRDIPQSKLKKLLVKTPSFQGDFESAKQNTELFEKTADQFKKSLKAQGIDLDKIGPPAATQKTPQ